MSKREKPELYKKVLEDLRGKSVDELEGLRLLVEDGLRGCADNAELAGSMLGEKLIKRLSADLEAIRRKYAGIKGNPEDQLAALHILQGREQQLSEELSNLTSANSVKINLGIQMEAVILSIGQGKREAKGQEAR
ncbi:MAG: hypothetical protein M0Q43_11800 [Methanothrix sp.]|jgi:hypothetical protein|nr:hypothetical protein [Methanothrix sp.]